jgi:transketolase C-terminal domain/subunit
VILLPDRLGETAFVLYDAHCDPRMGNAVACRRGSDVTLIRTGVIESRNLQAIWKTFDIMTAEVYSVIRGIGSAVVETVASGCRGAVVRTGIKDRLAEMRSFDELLRSPGPSVTDILAETGRAMRAPEE